MASEGIDLVVTDLDGTVWDSTGHIHPRTLDALRHFRSAGMPVLAATARRPSSVLRRLEANDILLPSVLFDGSLGRDFATGETFHRSLFDPAQAAWVLERLLVLGVEPCLNVDHPTHDVVLGQAPATHPGHLREIASVSRRADLEAVVGAEPVLSFIVCGQPRELLLAPAAALGAHVAVTVSRDTTFGGSTMSVRPQGVTKWTGVLAYCQGHGLDATRILAIGDGENDLELLRAASVACAVEGACEQLLALAHHQVPGPELGGWATIVELVGTMP